MNNLQIEQALQADSITRTVFVGVFAADTLPNKEYPGAYVCNTDPASLPGQHWIAFFLPRPGIVQSFDSFGKNPGEYSNYIKSWLGKDELVYSKKTFQTKDSVVCGNYCLFFILLRSYHVSYSDFISILSDNKNINDRFIHKFINKYFNMKTNLTDRSFMVTQIKRLMSGK